MTDTTVAPRVQTRGADRTTITSAPTRFADLGISPRVVDALAKRGLTEAFPIQSLVMPDALAGRDILAKSRTGSGKTLAFAIPLVETLTPSDRAPTALILAPTRELASQVTEEFRAIADVRRLKVAAVYGGVGIGPQAKIARHSDIVIATPGRLLDLVARKLLRLDRVRKVVLDEADRMLDMGFLPDVRRILELLRPDRQTMLFSATLDGDIGRLAETHTHDAVRHEIKEDRPVVSMATHRFLAVENAGKFRALVRELAADRGLTLVFVRTKRGADRIARNLKQEGFHAGALHGDMTQPQRERALGHFAAGRNDVLIATDVAARGLDLEHISHVINYDPPADDKAYVHRVGRTARAGRAGTGITFVTPDQGSDVGKIAKELSLHGEFADAGIRTAKPNGQAPRKNGNGGRARRPQPQPGSSRGRRRR
ncbi:MAG: DEAD/DEAH box helicase [Actinomycetota bacterium]